MISRLARATTMEIAAMQDPILVVPIGSCEQHGPHLPLNTDTYIAEFLCGELCLHNARFVLTPTIGISASGEHADFAGTLSIGSAALSQVLVELVRSAEWSAGAVFVNGHGGNLQAVTSAVQTLRNESRNVSSWWPRIANGDAHAGMTETSMMLVIAPHLVHLDMATAGSTIPLTDITNQLLAGKLKEISSNGVLGDPTSASADHGHALLSQLIEDLATFVARETTSWHITARQK